MNDEVVAPLCTLENYLLFLLFLLKKEKDTERGTRTKRPLHVFFIWCEKGTKSTSSEKRGQSQQAVGASRGR